MEHTDEEVRNLYKQLHEMKDKGLSMAFYATLSNKFTRLKIVSDGGNVKVWADGCKMAVNIPNGYGDCEADLDIFYLEQAKSFEDGMGISLIDALGILFQTSSIFSGTDMLITDTDSSDFSKGSVICRLSGTWESFTGDGHVMLVQISKEAY